MVAPVGVTRSPATTWLLEGLDVIDDGVPDPVHVSLGLRQQLEEGERVLEGGRIQSRREQVRADLAVRHVQVVVRVAVAVVMRPRVDFGGRLLDVEAAAVEDAVRVAQDVDAGTLALPSRVGGDLLELGHQPRHALGECVAHRRDENVAGDPADGIEVDTRQGGHEPKPTLSRRT